MDKVIEQLQTYFARSYTATALKILITVWGLMVIALAWSTDSAWLLAAILAYEVLP